MSWLLNVSESEGKSPEKTILFGPPGVGKTSAACSYPDAVVIPIESGLDALPKVKRFKTPSKWEDVEKITDECCEMAETGKFPFKSVVYDSLSALENLCWDYTLRNNFTKKIWESIDTPGWGKGEKAALKTWRRLITKLDRLNVAGVNIILIAHADIHNFKNPEGVDFDRYIMSMHKHASKLWFEWAAEVFFLRHDFGVSTTTDKAPGGKVKATGVSTSKRVVQTVWDAAFDSKHRIRVPGTITLPDPARGGSFYETLQAARTEEAARLLAGDDE